MSVQGDVYITHPKIECNGKTYIYNPRTGQWRVKQGDYAEKRDELYYAIAKLANIPPEIVEYLATEQTRLDETLGRTVPLGPVGVILELWGAVPLELRDAFIDYNMACGQPVTDEEDAAAVLAGTLLLRNNPVTRAMLSM